MDTAQFFDALAEVPNLRSASFVDVDMSETSSGDFKFDGIAAPVGAVSDLGDFTEEYERGSFRRFLRSNRENIPFLHEHNPRDLLATTKSGRLKLDEDVRGLRARADVVRTDLSERIKALVDAGDIGGMSIGMVVGRGNARIEQRSGRPHRAITGFKKLLDVCTTWDPAYVTTEAQFRTATLQFASSPDSLQQLLMGAYPQLGDGVTNLSVEDDELAPAEERSADRSEGEGEESGVADWEAAAAARARALSLMTLDLGGLDHAS